MLGSRRAQDVVLRSPVEIGRGGVAPVLFLAGFFAVFASATHIPIALAALLGAIGGTASLLLHELGHVRAARKLPGIRSANVSLVWLGAATRFEGKYRSGREQAKVAVAGPRASFAFALLLVGLCFIPMPVLFKDMLLVLALFNVLLGVLNLVPAYPLDGHKLVVGLLWGMTGSEKKARKIIRRIGFGWAAIEVPSAAVLLIEKPSFGIAAVIAAATFLAQKRFARRSPT